MMLPTHALAGMALALPLALAVPELGGVALVAGFLGGVLPDLDMYVGHRKKLHYPVYYSALALTAGLVAALAPSQVTVGAAAFLLGAAVHSLADVFGGGLELRPWEATSDRAVYDHHRETWLRPRHWIRYDGAPEDLLLCVALAVPLVVTLEGVLERVVLASLAVAVVYTAVRRSLPSVAERLSERFRREALPESVLTYVPARYLGREGDGVASSPAEER